ncbi:hypothetical protein RN346_11470 [Halomonas sp. PAMB 3232]|uniref:hypothetical protein n=1 Tax=Halomonas sp. PAMB 3232 TaxID=3075221 RepID=UPI00289872B8|nr:hypothetical protein [Halomonas sp. PAMB 3232]WNL37918.1 hypothetical protein RN346_11470 [Halomonas sp. PAMB 3232]
MTTSRPFLLLIVAPLAFTAVIGAVIFGNQALSSNKVDDEIRQAIAAELATSASVELTQLQEVQYGYGVCGLYQTAESDKGLASFFYDTTNHRLILDVNSRAYTANCGLSSVC